MSKGGRTPIYGGQGGTPFDDKVIFQPDELSIASIDIRAGSYIDAIRVTYSNGDQKMHGGPGGFKTTVFLNPGEKIISVSGRSGALIDQLSFYTNRGRTLGPFGGNGGGPFNAELGNGLLYIFGRSGRYLDAIGFAYEGY